MDLYGDAQAAKGYLMDLINECISSHKDVKAAIKARKARVVSAPIGGMVGVRLIGDETTLNLPYNSRLSENDLEVDSIVSVWYNYSLNNGIVMQVDDWSAAGKEIYLHKVWFLLAGGGGSTNKFYTTVYNYSESPFTDLYDFAFKMIGNGDVYPVMGVNTMTPNIAFVAVIKSHGHGSYHLEGNAGSATGEFDKEIFVSDIIFDNVIKI